MGSIQWKEHGNFSILVSLAMCLLCRSCPERLIVQCRLITGAQITGFKGALHQRYPYLKAAQLAWDNACLAGCVGPPKQWGAARAREVAPRLGGDLPTLYAIKFPPTALARHNTWYVVVMGAFPGVYAGW